ncbi:MAG: MetQ/NlpA family ABC transporter substrate-binding protein [Rectinemataceae bacterium]|nr:MetQ/NlpA family ABC transporter substrate-binding protein [Spirochaetaceae bacterium]
MRHNLMLVTALLLAVCCVGGASAADLSVGVFADADSLPLYVAQQEGLFAREGISVDLVRFASAVERDAALQAGRLDGAITDVLAVYLSQAGGTQLLITSHSDGRYGLVAAPSSPVRNTADLKGRKVGLSLNTVIHYVVDTSLADAGVDTTKVQLVPVPKMPVRLEMLLAGQVDAAAMPEPFLTAAAIRGARILVTTDDTGMDAGVIAFTAKALSTSLPAIKAFHKALWLAGQRINADPERYRPMLSGTLGFPEEAAAKFRFPRYRKPSLPTSASLDAAANWLLTKGLLKARPSSPITDDRPLAGW